HGRPMRAQAWPWLRRACLRGVAAGQGLIGAHHLAEPHTRSRVVGMEIGVQGLGQATERAFDLIVGRARLDAKHLIGIIHYPENPRYAGVLPAPSLRAGWGFGSLARNDVDELLPGGQKRHALRATTRRPDAGSCPELAHPEHGTGHHAGPLLAR